MDTTDEYFREIYDAFQPRIRRYLTHTVGPDEAEDLCQDVFVKVNKALPGFRGDSQLSTWLYRIATNAALDRLRSPSFRKIPPGMLSDDSTEGGESEIDDGDAWTGDKSLSVEEEVARKEMDECGLDLINRLPASYRTVLVLSDLEGLRNSEIAEILGLSLDTVKIRLHRARARLKEALQARCDFTWFEDNEFVPDLKDVFGQTHTED